jgi:fengycin family lipopeptide synthetase D
MRLVVLAGEASGPALLRKSREKVPDVRIANEYGPTEGTVAATAHPEIAETAVNIIGNPIANAKIYILDDSFQPVFPGAAGEVCIAGDGVARGYLNRPELTAEKFDQDLLDFQDYRDAEKKKNYQKFLRGGPGGAVFSKSAPPGRRRQYKTGDLARWLPGGSIEFLGRKDLQVKVRGHRIELEQVEVLLTGHEKIKEALAVTRGAAENKYICAYIIPGEGQEFPTAEIKNYIQGRLPYYMVPSRIIRLEAFPLTPNGKIDRKALPDPDFTADEEYAAPRGPLEEALVQLWAEVLGTGPERIGIDSSFFDLGGHSLRATMLVSRIEKEMDVKIPLGRFFNTPTIRELSALMDTAPQESGETGAAVFARGTFAPIRPVEKKEYYPVSSQQKRLYTLRQFTGEGTAYNVLSVHWLKGTVDVQRIGSAFQRLLEKHEAFRTGFRVLEGEPVQEIRDRVDLKPVYEELQDRETAAEYVKKCKREFDLSRPPLLRVTLVRVAGSEYLMLVDMHHIAADGASTAILIDELARAYEGEEPAPLRVQYKEYAVWQRALPGEPGFAGQEEYWLKGFAGEIPVLNLPTDYPRPPLQSFEGALWSSRLSDCAGARLKQVCQEYDVTVYMVLMACYQVLLAKYSGQEDVIVGSPVASRDHADTEGIVGMFANTLALRGQPVGEKEFHCFLAEIKQIALDAYENQGYPFEELLEKVEVTRDVSRNPLFDTMFILQDIGMGPLKMGDIEITPYKEESDTAKFDLTFAVSESEQEITCTIEYCTRLFKEETVARIGVHYGRILEQVLEEPGKKIAEIDMVMEEEKEQLLYDFNDTAVEYPRDKTISQLFAGQVERTPDHVALIGPEGEAKKRRSEEEKREGESIHLTYKELNEQSNRVARFLIEEGVLADSIVGIMMERSLEMIIGILGILKAGGAYLPIDPDYPRERIDYMLKDSNARVLLKKSEIRISKFENFRHCFEF